MRYFFALLVLAIFTVAATADDRGWYGSGKSKVYVDITVPNPTSGELCIEIKNGDDKGTGIGTPDISGDGRDVLESEEIEVGDDTYRFAVSSGKTRLQRKKGETWVNMPGPRKKASDTPGSGFFSLPSVERLGGYSGGRIGNVYTAPGEEVTGLP